MRTAFLLIAALACAGADQSFSVPAELPGTAPLRLGTDWREQQRQEIIGYLDGRIVRTQSTRDALWKPAFASQQSFGSIARQQRSELRKMLGVEEHPGATDTTTPLHSYLKEVVVTSPDGFYARALFSASGTQKRLTIAIPAQDQTAEAFFASSEARALMNDGDAIAVMTTVPRDANQQIAKITLQLKEADRRRVLHRLAFITGKTIPGLEVEQALAIRDALARMPQFATARFRVYGDEQGGMTALLAAALDTRFEEATVNHYYGASLTASEQSFDRMLYGQLNRFGDAEIAALIAPRKLTLGLTETRDVQSELARAKAYYRAAGGLEKLILVTATPMTQSSSDEENARAAVDRNFDALHSYLRRRIEASEAVRTRRWNLVNATSPEKKSEELRRELEAWMGVPDEPPAEMRPRTRLIRVTGHYTAYEVMLNVLDGVQVYGHLLIPREHTKRLPAIVCQHGLGGQPKDITGLGEEPDKVYHEFGARLAEQGYVVFAPYVTVPIPQRELINPIVRKAAALGMMRTAIEVRKLRRVVDFLQTLPYVDGSHIGYYGLSYGGYSAIWMGPLETRLRSVIVSGHFNDWTSKISSDATRTSYLLHPDEDFFNWDVLHRFTHPELIASMFPRAVMVEFADRDGTTTPEWHERAWNQVLQVARAWKAEDRFQRDVFNGVHEIGGMRTFDFQARWLKPDITPSRTYTYLLWPTSRDLPGIGDGDEDTVPYVKGQLGSKELPKLQDAFSVGKSETAFQGLRLRVSRVDHPSALLVRYGTTPGGAELGQSSMAPDGINPLFDIWYDAQIPPVTLLPNKTYYVTVAEESPDFGRGHYIVYGRRPLGGQARPGNFYFAYQRIAPHSSRVPEETLEFVRTYLQHPTPPVFKKVRTVKPGDVLLTDSEWAMDSRVSGEVAATAVRGLEGFLRSCCAIRLQRPAAKRIVLQILPAVNGITTSEGFSVTAGVAEIRINAITERGIMRGIYWLEDEIRTHQMPAVKPGTVVRNSRFSTRITTSVYIGGLRYTESSRPFIYTDGLLERISRDGFNGIWIWLNVEAAAGHLTTFKELEDPEADLRLQRIQELSERARRYGVDVYVYLATNYNHPVPDSFYQKYPEAKGIGYNNAMCTSDARVRKYHHEVVRNIVTRAPGIRGFVIIYDSEGFYYCGNSDRSRQRCPRCRNYTCEHLALQVLTNINDAMHEAGGPEKQLIAFSYSRNADWVKRLLPTLPKDIALQVDFSKGGLIERDGIRHQTGDYNLTLLGPPEQFVEHNQLAQKLGLKFISKTEHAVSQEFIFVPYIPAMDQWLRRIEKIREYPAEGWFGNWCHVGYLASLPAQLITRMSFDPPPLGGSILAELARNNYGEAAVPHVLKAWTVFSEGIRQFPYSDNVSRIPGPLQKGPSNPFFLDASVPSFGRWRAWQNDLKWTEPWGPAVASKYLAIVRERFHQGIAHLEAAKAAASEQFHRDAIAGEWRIARSIESSLTTILNQIDWIQERDRFHAATSSAERAESAAKLRAILLRERDNVLDVLPLLDQDSRLGYASEGGGVIRGGLFTPELVRWKLGEIEDTLARQLPEQMASQRP